MNTAMDTLVMEPPSIYKAVAPPDAAITGRIHHIRGQKVMSLLRRRLREGAVGFKPEASSPSTCPPAPNSGNCSPA
jgi:hypothetical protein